MQPRRTLNPEPTHERYCEIEECGQCMWNALEEMPGTREEKLEAFASAISQGRVNVQACRDDLMADVFPYYEKLRKKDAVG